MTAEEVWRKASGAYEDAANEHLELPMRDMVLAGDQAAISVIRTAMEAYAAEKVAEERAAIVAWLRAHVHEVASDTAYWQTLYFHW